MRELLEGRNQGAHLMKNDSRTDLSALWTAYKDNGDEDSREHLILNYSPLVKYVAGRLSTSLPQTVETADLVSYGLFGLIDAIEKFDPERGIKFETYAIARIKGAIIDELRSMDWVPRSMRADAKRMDKATEALHQRLGRHPLQNEIAVEMNCSVEDIDVLQAMIHSTTSMEGLDQGSDDDEGASVSETLGDGPGGTAESFLDESHIRDHLVEAITSLGQRERTVIALYYFEGLNFSDIGRIIGVTESRVCQIHTRSSKFLRAQMRERIAV